MNDARQEILGRIRQSLGEVPPNRSENYDVLARDYVQAGVLDVESRLALFEERLREYDAVVYRCSQVTLCATIAEALKQRGKHRMLVPEGMAADWLPEQVEFVRDSGLSYEDLDRSEGVLTSCAVAIAITGSIVLQHSRSAGRRAATLIPDYHLCVVHAEQIVETVAEGIRALKNTTEPVTTIAGPSATADIEMTRIKGVHGPRTLDVIVVVD